MRAQDLAQTDRAADAPHGQRGISQTDRVIDRRDVVEGRAGVTRQGAQQTRVFAAVGMIMLRDRARVRPGAIEQLLKPDDEDVGKSDKGIVAVARPSFDFARDRMWQRSEWPKEPKEPRPQARRVGIHRRFGQVGRREAGIGVLPQRDHVLTDPPALSNPRLLAGAPFQIPHRLQKAPGAASFLLFGVGLLVHSNGPDPPRGGHILTCLPLELTTTHCVNVLTAA